MKKLTPVFIQNAAPMVNVYKNGQLVTAVPKQQFQRQENNSMSYRNYGNGAGVPLEMPSIQDLDKKSMDPVQRVHDHLISKYGRAGADEKLRAMSGLEVLQLAETLKTQPEDTGNAMPTL